MSETDFFWGAEFCLRGGWVVQRGVGGGWGGPAPSPGDPELFEVLKAPMKIFA